MQGANTATNIRMMTRAPPANAALSLRNTFQASCQKLRWMMAASICASSRPCPPEQFGSFIAIPRHLLSWQRDPAGGARPWEGVALP